MMKKYLNLMLARKAKRRACAENNSFKGSSSASDSRLSTNDCKAAPSLGAASAAGYGAPKNVQLGNSGDGRTLDSSLLRGGGSMNAAASLSSSSPSANGSKSMKVMIGNKMTDIAELERLMAQKDDLIQQQSKEIKAHLEKVRKLEDEVKCLKSECDKLRSVLDLKVTESPAKGKSSDELRAEVQKDASMLGQTVNIKKQGVSAEPIPYSKESRVSLSHFTKSPPAKHLIRNAILQNDFLRHLDREQVSEMVECAYERDVDANQFVIQEGTAGTHLYVAAAGELQVSKGSKVLGRMGPGKVFGELALLYNCTRTASVKALSPVKLWVLDRAVFQMITMRLGLQRHEMLMDFLREVPLFKTLTEDRISKLADSMDLDYFAEGTYIVREGEKGDLFFIISSGQVRVTQLIEGFDEPQEVRILNKGDFFGEKALLGDEVRTASVVAADAVEVLTLDQESFRKLIGDLEELKKDYGDEKRGARRIAEKRASLGEGVGPGKATKVELDKEMIELEISHLRSVATLGVGGFGRVELVFVIKDPTKTYALKAMKKKHIIDTRQQEHIFNERNLMFEFRSPYVVRLYKTFRDRKYVYMLLEACLGGELWTLLRDRGHFDENTARFFVACVVEALEYLHKRLVIYRDLKPENCLLDATGHLKIVDFGFAKRLHPGRKTWTFCGTPEYVAPEIILNKGHDHSADFWALGIFICELLMGRPPFQASDPMKTYTLILKGVDALDIPNRRIGKTATSLVKKLCRDNPAERLGCQFGGFDDLRKHRWFSGFDWEGLRNRMLPPPIVPKINGPSDVSNFDHYPSDYDIPPDELSGWDEGF